ncbi:AbrB/MazE/SpoVT family DNA-binding domain-containing protein [Wenzhouxiangella sp. XN79A]|uniref:AbrB/MazE/SpoVT family DNA-binding domain-containing protein n=1 Tax=Wenzhouxiangella sp. XN79A TaxID=2724193 RepID=UPI00144A8552|nr:AbrB/MazE/SpoVT family DNA-binding domain-containing protein [Wenzhouxiangella sp. XN79A]NKI35102.1 AbrB/MazE/SpoVT family DNA-binding domain-containing protein [Wenzhouxiangella sp. XN79A]
MPKITSKLQVTLPKRIAEHHGLHPGDEIEFQSAGDVIRILPAGTVAGSQPSAAERLRLFDEATRRQAQRQADRPTAGTDPAPRDWNREDLYRRGHED